MILSGLAAALALALPTGAQTLPAALIWSPPASFSDWRQVDAMLRSRPGFRMTIALTPAQATPAVKLILVPWTAIGRLEVAARIPGDPLLSQVAAHPDAPRPEDALDRSAAAIAEIGEKLGLAPAGLIPGAGELDPSLIQPIGASGAKWILVGSYAEVTSAWAAAGEATFIPARSCPTVGVFSPDCLTASGAAIIDESAAPIARLPTLFAGLPTQLSPLGGWATGSQLAAAKKDARLDAASQASWPGWSVAAPGDAGAQAALTSYAEAAKALVHYQNSGAADLHVLEKATALIRRAQDARFFAPNTPPADREDLRRRLLAVYRALKAAAPDALYSSASSSTTASTESPTGVKSTAGAGWVEFDNPSGSLARLPSGAPSSDPWKIHNLRLEWDTARVLVRIGVAGVAVPLSVPRAVYDVYIDLNHVVGAGSIRLLDGRGAFAQARDAWEFALTSVGKDARLFRASATGDPEEVGQLEAQADAARGEIRIEVPRSLLRGNPGRWGYIAVSLAEDPLRPGAAPATIMLGEDGTLTRGLLGSIDIQKSVIEHPSTPPRIPAVRIE